MNCQEVEIIITDLARGCALEVEARDGALAHLKGCRRCGESLAEQEKLSQELSAWAAGSLDEQAPASLEEKLRLAFRQNTAPAPRRRWLIVATAGSIAAGILLFKLMAPQPPPVASVAPVHQPETQSIRPVEVRSAASDSPARIRKKRNRQVNRVSRPEPQAPAPAELQTEFLPVLHGDGWTPLDGGRLVRVRLPRSAMGVFGLPVEEGRTQDRVQADVMLSDDGALRAIRFVR